ncbi:hypothetical protein ACIOJG_02750 [Streptomyces anulatus]
MGRTRTGAVSPVTEAAPAVAPGSVPYAAGGPAPVRRLTVLYDAQCPLCVHLRHWLQRQRQLVPLDLVPAGSAEARRRFPELDHAATPAGRPFVRGTVLAAARYRSLALPPCAPGVRECAAPPGGPWGPR